MSQQLLGGNASTTDYDYQSGSGMDNFMSRSLDEVGWEATLGSVYTTLNTLPIGLSPTTATATNYDATQITGSVGGNTQLGQTQVTQSGALNTVDASGSTVLQVGTLNG